MAKPIFIATIRNANGEMPTSVKREIRDKLNEQLKEDYHVLFVFKDNEYGGASFECFNDCKGLPDIDIEKLIKNYETKIINHA